MHRDARRGSPPLLLATRLAGLLLRRASSGSSRGLGGGWAGPAAAACAWALAVTPRVCPVALPSDALGAPAVPPAATACGRLGQCL